LFGHKEFVVRYYVISFKKFDDPGIKGILRKIMEFPGNFITKYSWGIRSRHIAIIKSVDKINGTGLRLNVIEAVGKGVTEHSYEYDPYVHDIYFLELEDQNYVKIMQWLWKQLGKKYDFLGLFGFLFRSDKWQNLHKWFCSELAMYPLFLYHIPVYNWKVIFPHQITPRLAIAIMQPVEDPFAEFC
jgi:hypothetical protein